MTRLVPERSSPSYKSSAKSREASQGLPLSTAAHGRRLSRGWRDGTTGYGEGRAPAGFPVKVAITYVAQGATQAVDWRQLQERPWFASTHADPGTLSAVAHSMSVEQVMHFASGREQKFAPPVARKPTQAPAPQPSALVRQTSFSIV